MAELTQISVPKPVQGISPNFRFCPRCGQEAMEPAAHVYDCNNLISTNGFQCQECGIFFTGTHLGISYSEV